MSHLAQKVLPAKGVFKSTSVGNVIIIGYQNGALYALLTKDKDGVVQNISLQTGKDANGNPTYTSYPLNKALPRAPTLSEIPAYMEDHPLVTELALTMAGVIEARDLLITKCAGDTAASEALAKLINTYGF